MMVVAKAEFAQSYIVQAKIAFLCIFCSIIDFSLNNMMINYMLYSEKGVVD